jgi:cyclin B
MLIGSKYEEIYAPEVKDFVYISDKAYTWDEIMKMESLMLNTLGFNLTVPSPLQFLARFVKAADLKDDVKFTMMASYTVELTMQEYFMMKYLPSMIAASAVFLSLKILGRGGWTATLHRHTHYGEASLKNCSADLFVLLKAARGTPQLQTVRKQYASAKYGEVSKIRIDSICDTMHKALLMPGVSMRAVSGGVETAIGGRR